MALKQCISVMRRQAICSASAPFSRRAVVSVHAAAGAADNSPKVVGRAVLIEKLAKNAELDLTKEKASKVIDSVFGAIEDAVTSGSRVTIIGFGTFEQRERKARNGRNPSTGEAISIPASKTPAFKPAASFKGKVNGKPLVEKPKATAPSPAPKSATASAAPGVRPVSPAPAVRKPAAPKHKK